MQTSPRRVLIVDDEGLVRRALVRMVKRQGWQAAEAEGGEQGLALLEQQQFEVVLSDFLMPTMNGIDFLAQVKERWPQVPRILLTGHVEQQALKDAINRCEVFRFLTKPWDDAELRSTLVSAFERYETRESELRRLSLLLAHSEGLESPAGLQENRTSSPAAFEQTVAGSELALSPVERPNAVLDAGARARQAKLAEGAIGRAAAPAETEAEAEAEENRDHPLHPNAEASDCGCVRAERLASTKPVARLNGQRSALVNAIVCKPSGEHPLTGPMVRDAKLAAVEAVADLVAHETNNALGTVIVLTQMMRQEPGRSAEDLECLQDIEAAAVRCEDLVGGFARLGGGSQGALPFELRDTIADALLLNRLHFKYQSKVRLEAQLTAEPLRICGERSLVQLALGAMLAQATARALEAGEGVVQLLSSRQGESAEVVVLDCGRPLSAEELGRLVEPSFAGQGSDKAGAGALAVSAAIALHHGGCLEVGKREGGGNTYTLRLPLIE